MTMLLPGPGARAPRRTLNTRLAPVIGAGFAVLLIGFGGFVAWSATAPLSSAAIAPGVVVVETKRKAIQHLEGGIVKEIHVQEGDRVDAGDTLVSLDATKAQTTLDQLDAEYVSTLAKIARLTAERDELGEIDYGPDLAGRRGERDVERAIAGEANRFRTRRQSIDERVSVLKRQIQQIEEEIGGQAGRLRADEIQLELLGEETAAQKDLLAKGLTTKPRVLELRRELAAAEARAGDQRALMAQSGQRIAETQLKIMNIRTEFLDGVVDELQELQPRANELREQITAAEAVLARTQIRAPSRGTVVGMTVHTIGGVIDSKDTLMEIVPAGDELIVEASVRPEDIEAVHEGMRAQVRLTSYSFRKTSPLFGEVIYVAADRTTEPKTDMPIYMVKVRIDQDALAAQPGVTLQAGMPAEVQILLGERTLADYLIEPMMQSFSRGLREG